MANNDKMREMFEDWNLAQDKHTRPLVHFNREITLPVWEAAWQASQVEIYSMELQRNELMSMLVQTHGVLFESGTEETLSIAKILATMIDKKIDDFQIKGFKKRSQLHTNESVKE